ncbi:hypothetical protein UPYG_G00067330 [Umbra pygmaea]|uniref:Uncharacterized protein n=1 Tax=Umbra pygmaea TaxID=75934 RepID=A0ABD0XBB3_UMBPY
MSKLELLSVYLNERLTAAAVEILGAVEKTFVEYQEENHRLRKLLRITPEIQLSRIDSMQFSLSVCEDESRFGDVTRPVWFAVRPLCHKEADNYFWV